MAHALKVNRLAPPLFEELRQFSTCITASAIESFHVRLYNTGFANSSIRCQFQDRPPVLGYAATARMRAEDPPMEGEGYFYYDRTDWWKHILTVPPPRVVVIENMDEHPGLGAFVGAVHAHILAALGCVALVTNGAVRDIAEVRAAGLQVFASNLTVSHAYAHIFDFGGKVKVGGLEVAPGELVHGDVHGVQTIPAEIAPRLPAVIREVLNRRTRLIALCRSGDFSLEKLEKLIKKEEEELNV
jgi:4-hydroxy-4-methyl-2-oxoglutarate aldolase